MKEIRCMKDDLILVWRYNFSNLLSQIPSNEGRKCSILQCSYTYENDRTDAGGRQDMIPMFTECTFRFHLRGTMVVKLKQKIKLVLKMSKQIKCFWLLWIAYFLSIAQNKQFKVKIKKNMINVQDISDKVKATFGIMGKIP